MIGGPVHGARLRFGERWAKAAPDKNAAVSANAIPLMITGAPESVRLP
jgi:hypothetical protein